jgi:hypothetical protein
MDREKEITSRIYARHLNVVEHIKSFPETIYVAKCFDGKWAKLTYERYGLGIGCFLSKADGESWQGSDKFKLTLIEMRKADAIKIAKNENLSYLHLLSHDKDAPLNHLKIS